MAPGVDIVTVGHAIVDVLAHTPDEVVSGLGLTKGTMTLVDELESERMHAAAGPSTSASGGSAANTAAGLASLGARSGFLGKVRDDALGQVFISDIRAAGVHFEVPAATVGPATGRCVVFVTPDAEKTMCTHLGIGDLLGPDDVDTDLVASASIVYLEGYLCGLPHTDPTVDVVLAAAEAGGTRVALSLSDPFWVELHGAELAALLPRVQLLFANEMEACGLTGLGDVTLAAADLATRCETVVVTLGARGSLVVSNGSRIEVPAVPVGRLVDTTGAGDLFAAGYLYGELRGDDLERAALLGSLAAAEVVGHLGPRPLGSLRELADRAGLS